MPFVKNQVSQQDSWYYFKLNSCLSYIYINITTYFLGVNIITTFVYHDNRKLSFILSCFQESKNF
jgi:hypothetical protein